MERKSFMGRKLPPPFLKPENKFRTMPIKPKESVTGAGSGKKKVKKAIKKKDVLKLAKLLLKQKLKTRPLRPMKMSSHPRK